MLLIKVAAEMVTFEGNVTSAVEMVDVTISSTPPPAPIVLFAIAARLLTSVASVVAATVVIVVDDVARVIGTNFVANVGVIVDQGSRGVDATTVAIVVGCSVDAMELAIVAIVVLIGASVGTNGNCGHGCLICGPSILSNTYPMSEPAVNPILYERVIMLPDKKNINQLLMKFTESVCETRQ